MATLGQNLKRERELRGISLKEIADTTKINLSFLRSLEEDQIDALPGRFFIKGIIRAHTGHLGLDTDEFLNQFMEEERLRSEMKDVPPREPRINKPAAHKMRNFLIFCLVVIVLAACLTAVYLLFRGGNHPILEEQILPTLLSKKTSPVPDEVREEIQAVETGLVMNLDFQEETWIEIHSDGSLILEGNQSQGFHFRATAENELIIHCGNLGGFTFTLNGLPGKQMGRSGDVLRNIRITPDTMDQFLDKTPNPRNSPD
ncbi:MAG: DUF4115 domain-containing protein [Candidatus Aminicenantes bacterium]|nr:DUF4115 domain-containing protein [Candidatus Aminicenantes bacterium]